MVPYAKLMDEWMVWVQDEHKRLQADYKRLQDHCDSLQRQTDLFGNTSIAAVGAASLRIDTDPSSSPSSSSSSSSTSNGNGVSGGAPTASAVPSTPVGRSVPPSPMPQIVPVVLW
jgi:hypothetical protein